MHHHHGLDGVRLVVGQFRRDRRRIDAMAPVAGNEIHLHPPARRQLLPQSGELAGLGHQHAVAGRQSVDDCRFPRPGAGCRIDDHGAGCAEHRPDGLQHLMSQFLEVWTAMVDHLAVDGALDALGHRAGSGNLEEMLTLCHDRP